MDRTGFYRIEMLLSLSLSTLLFLYINAPLLSNRASFSLNHPFSILLSLALFGAPAAPKGRAGASAVIRLRVYPLD